ncbi:TPA: restriction endonuclease subunit S [Klebsiella pneumoniae]|nr:restriction endonuclease subunit S [Klebsiella pneumoniae]
MEARKAYIQDNQEYDLVTVKRSRGGVIRREHLKGKDISVKSQFYIKEGDFLISKRQIVHGACGLVPKELSGSIVSNEYCVLTGKSGFYLPYMEFLSESLYFQQTCFHSSIGVHIEKMIFKLDSWFKWPFNIPPLSEQKRIVKILSTWDEAISVTEKLLTNSQQQKKALMQQLLTGNKRLLDENGVRFSGEWKITKLIQMGKVVSGGTPDTNMAMYWEGDILWLTPTDVTALTGRFVSNTSRKITPAGLLNSSAVLLPKGSLMVCTRATIGALAISTSEICTNQGFKNIIPNEGFNIEFIYYLLQMNTNEMIKKSSGSTFLELSKKDFETLSFSCPFIKEQQKIAAVLSAAETEISTLEKKLACLKDEKKALMQQLLTGKRRVKVDEAVAV